MVIQALIPFTELNSRAIFTQKVLYNDVVSDRDLSDVEGNADYYQRRLSPVRLREIKRYIYNAILDEKENVAVSALFPTAMILAVDFEDALTVNDGSVDFKLSDDQRVYVVDGQHRLMAMRQLYEDLSSRRLIAGENEEYIFDYLRNYSFNCTILVNYDIWEQGQVFVNVNFRQKPVSRSLYYDVYGAEYVEDNNPKNLNRNKIYLAHELTRFMNEQIGSPFYRNIRMLGTGKGYVSQSFFVEALLPLFKDNGPWRFDTMSLESALKVLSLAKSELYNFFKAVSRCFSDIWGKNKEGKVNFICKTTGVGAFIKLMARLHWQVSSEVLDELQNSSLDIDCKKYCGEIEKYLAPLLACKKELFGTDSQYGKTGGKGIESTLFNRMIEILQQRKLLNESQEDKSQLKGMSLVKATFSQKYLSYLMRFGIDDIEKRLETYMNRHLPSEIDALGTHSRVDDISKLLVAQVMTDNEKSKLYITGTFDCAVEVRYGSENDDIKLKHSFPGTFRLSLMKNEERWDLDEEECRVYVNTERYYK